MSHSFPSTHFLFLFMSLKDHDISSTKGSKNYFYFYLHAHKSDFIAKSVSSFKSPLKTQSYEQGFMWYRSLCTAVREFRITEGYLYFLCFSCIITLLLLFHIFLQAHTFMSNFNQFSMVFLFVGMFVYLVYYHHLYSLLLLLFIVLCVKN